MPDVILIKPHHFVDVLRSLGDDALDLAPHPYGHNLHGVAARILASRDIVLQIDIGTDDICRPCIHNVEGVCDDVIDTSLRPAAPRSKQDWNRLIDQRWCSVLGLASGNRITARQLCALLAQHTDDLSVIYTELPPQRVTARAESLRRGIERFGDQNVASTKRTRRRRR